MLPKITHPTFEVTIPSTKTKVQMRPMLVREEKILLMAKESGDPRDVLSGVTQVVGACMDSSVNVRELALFDIDYLFVKLRSQSVSNKTKVAYRDNDDEELYEFVIDLDKIDVKWPENMDRTIMVSKDVGIIMRYPPAYLYSDDAFRSASGNDLFNLLLQASIETIFMGKTRIDPKTEPDLLQWIDDLEIGPYNKVRDFFNDLPSLYHKIEYENKNGKKREIVLSTLNDFFTLV